MYNSDTLWYKPGTLAGTLIKWREQALSLFFMLNTNTDKLHSLYLYELLGGETGSGLQENFNDNLWQNTKIYVLKFNIHYLNL